MVKEIQVMKGKEKELTRSGMESGIATPLPAVQSVRDFLSVSLKGYT